MINASFFMSISTSSNFEFPCEEPVWLFRWVVTLFSSVPLLGPFLALLNRRQPVRFVIPALAIGGAKYRAWLGNGSPLSSGTVYRC